jgi:hypothetical protein
MGLQDANTEADLPEVPGHGRTDVLTLTCEGCNAQCHCDKIDSDIYPDGAIDITNMTGWHFEEGDWLCPKCVRDAQEEAEAARQ